MNVNYLTIYSQMIPIELFSFYPCSEAHKLQMNHSK